MPKNDIIYPIFLECCQFTEDSCWESIFEDLAYGKAPHKTYINKEFLCCGYKGKEFSYKIERKDPKELYTEVYNLLANKVGIFSQKESLKKRLDFHQLETTIKNAHEKWSDIRKKNIKDLLIERYVIKLKKEHSLTVKQSKYLLGLILIALVFKTITMKDIEYEDGEIQNIKGIEINGGDIKLSKDIFSTPMTPCKSEVLTPSTKSLSDHWEKYLKQFDNEE